MRIRASIIVGTALFLNTVSSASSTVLDYEKNLLIQQIDALKTIEHFTMFSAKMVMDQTSIRNPILGSCFQYESGTFNQFSLYVSNVTTLVAVYRIVSNSEEKRQILTLLQTAITAAQGAGQLVTQTVHNVENMAPCQGSELTALGQSATAIATDINGTLAKMVSE